MCLPANRVRISDVLNDICSSPPGDDLRKFEQSFNLGLPMWYYQIWSDDSRIAKVELDGKPLFEQRCGTRLWLEGGSHTLTIHYRDGGHGIAPWIDIKGWPFTPKTCAADSGEPPPSSSQPPQPPPTTVAPTPGTPIGPPWPIPTPQPACDPSRTGVILYSERDYQGRCTHLTSDHPNLDQLAVGDNAVSSIRVNGNFRVNLYEHTNYGGRHDVVTASDPDLDRRSLGGQFSSVRIESRVQCENERLPGVFLYSERNYGGNCAHLTSSVSNLANTPVGDNNVSSVRINGEYELRLYEHTGFEGRSDPISKNEPNLDGRSLGGQYSSARVQLPVRCTDTGRPGVYLYREKNYRGNCAYLTEDARDLGTTPVGDNRTRSLRIVGDYEVRLYEHRDFGGRSDPFGRDQSDLTWRSLGDQYSSIRVSRINRPPTISLNRANDVSISRNGQAIWSNQRDWSFSGTASDPDGDLSRVLFNCQGDSCNERNRPVSGAQNWSYSHSGLSGRNRIYFHAVDQQGLTSDKDNRHSIDLFVDLAPPRTTLSLNQEAAPDRWPTWFTGPVTVQLYAQDGATGNARSGVATVHYRHNQGGWQSVSADKASFVIEQDGPHTVEFYAIDKVGNQESPQTVHFQLDGTPPSAPTGVVETNGVVHEQWQNQHDIPAFTWNAATDNFSGVWGYQFYFGAEPDGTSAHRTFTAAEERMWQPRPEGVRTDTYYLRGRTRDNAGNWSDWATLFVFRYDGTPPDNPDMATHDGGVAHRVWQRSTSHADFRWETPQDLGSGVDGYHVYWGTDPDGTSEQFTQENRFQSTEPLCAPDETCVGYLRLRAVDRVGNRAENWTTAFILRYDNTPPTLDFTFLGGVTQTTRALVTVDLNAHDAGSGVAEMRFSNDNSQWSDWEPYAEQRIWSIPAISGQSWPIYVQVRDGVGLESDIVERSIYLDVNAQQPESENFRLFDYALSAGGRTHMSSSGFSASSVTGEVADARTMHSANYQIWGGYTAGSQAIPIVRPGTGDSDTSPSIPPPPPPGSTPDPETVKCEFPQISINDGAVFTNQTEVVLSLCAPNAVEMIISNDGGFGDAAWEPYQERKPWTITTHGQHVLPRFVYAAFRDQDGTVFSTYFDDIIYDPTPPSGYISVGDPLPAELLAQASSTNRMARVAGATQLSIAGLPEDAPIVIASTDSDGMLDLYINAWDDVGNVVGVQISDNSEFADAAWEPYSAYRQWRPPDEDGFHTLFARFRDEAGNVSPPTSVGYILDTTPPWAGVFVADRMVSSEAVAVTVYFAALDNLTEVVDMRVSHDPTFSEVPWIPFTWLMDWPIQEELGEGEYRIHAQFRDSEGNLSDIYSDVFVIDTTAPLVHVEVEPGEGLERLIHVNAYDEWSDIDAIRVSNDPLFEENVAVMSRSGEIVWLFDDRKIVWVQAEDSVGNRSEPVAFHIGDLESPEEPSDPDPESPDTIGTYLPMVEHGSPFESNPPTTTLYVPMISR